MRSIRQYTLAVTLLLAFVLSGFAAPLAVARSKAAGACAAAAGEVFLDNTYRHIGEALHSSGPVLNVSAHNGGDTGIRGSHPIRLSGALPASTGPSPAGQSQACLKQRLYQLLTATEWQQRLALYPKHGFW